LSPPPGESGNSVSVEATLSGVFNTGTLNTDGGNDILTGIFNNQNATYFPGYGIYNKSGTIDTGAGNDIISGISQSTRFLAVGIYHESGTIDTGNGNDIIIGITYEGVGIESRSTINTGDGNDAITGGATSCYLFWYGLILRIC
jgi:hypothetical protein